MTEIARMTPTIPRGKIIGKRMGEPPLSQAERVHKCEARGGWLDMRDLGTVVCTENLIRVDAVMESPKLAE
jgi:hypothetical protein